MPVLAGPKPWVYVPDISPLPLVLRGVKTRRGGSRRDYHDSDECNGTLGRGTFELPKGDEKHLSLLTSCEKVTPNEGAQRFKQSPLRRSIPAINAALLIFMGNCAVLVNSSSKFPLSMRRVKPWWPGGNATVLIDAAAPYAGCCLLRRWIGDLPFRLLGAADPSSLVSTPAMLKMLL